MGKRRKKNFFRKLIRSAFTWREHEIKERRKIKELKKRFVRNRMHAHKHQKMSAWQMFKKLLKTDSISQNSPLQHHKHIHRKAGHKKESFFKVFFKDLFKSRNYPGHKVKTLSHFKKQKPLAVKVADFREGKSGKHLKEIRKKEARIRKIQRKENLKSSYIDFIKALFILLKLPRIILYIISGKKGYTPNEIKAKVIAALRKYSPIRKKSHNDEKKKISFFKKIYFMFSLGNKDVIAVLRRKRKAIEESFKKGYDNTKTVVENEVQRGKFIYTAINSTVVYMLSFLFIYIIYQLATVLVAAHFDLTSTLFYYGIRWPGPDSSLWTFDSVIAIFMAGPVISLLLGLSLLALFYIFIVKDGFASLKLFFVWSYIHAFNMFFGAFIVGVITEKGFGYAQDWLYLNTTDKYIISTISIFILALIGFLSTSHFLQCSLSNFIIRKDNRILFIISQVFIPWLLGSFLILLIKIPSNTYHESLIFVPLVFVFLPIFPNYFSFWTARIKIPPKRRELQIEKTQIVILTIVMIIFRVVLNFGITF